MKIRIKNINTLNFGWNSSINSRFCHTNVVLNFALNFLTFFWHKFLSWVQFPSSCKISNQPMKCQEMRANTNFKIINSKCPNIKILPYGLAPTLTCSQSTNVILINSYSGTLCSISWPTYSFLFAKNKYFFKMKPSLMYPLPKSLK